jgi:hypothetical protein
MEHLPWVLLGLRAAPKEDCGFSSAKMVYGAPLTLPGKFLGAEEAPSPSFLAELRAKMFGFQPPGVWRPPPAASSGLPSNLLQAEMVYIRRGGGTIKPLSPLYDGPYRVLDRREKYFRVDIGGRAEAVSADRLKPHLGPSGATPAVPAKRGWPPGPGWPERTSPV